MSAEDPRIPLVLQGLAAVNAGDMERFLPMLTPEAVSRVVSPLPNAGQWTGPDGFLAMNAAWSEAWDEISYELVGHESVDEHTLVLQIHQEAQGAGSGVPVTLDTYYLIAFEGERISRLEIHQDRESALASAE